MAAYAAAASEQNNAVIFATLRVMSSDRSSMCPECAPNFLVVKKTGCIQVLPFSIGSSQ